MLESIQANGFGGGRDITHIIALDEGHDRFYWEWVKHPQMRKFGTSSVWIPEAPETALRDGLLMLIADGLGDKSLQALVPYVGGIFGRADLNRNEALPGGLSAEISHALVDHHIRLLTYQDSSIKDLTPWASIIKHSEIC